MVHHIRRRPGACENACVRRGGSCLSVMRVVGGGDSGGVDEFRTLPTVPPEVTPHISLLIPPPLPTSTPEPTPSVTSEKQEQEVSYFCLFKKTELNLFTEILLLT